MDQALLRNALAYASCHKLEIAERLGFGIHGIIFVVKDNAGNKSAIKIHRESEPFLRECAVYDRLEQASLTKLLGFNVPQCLRVDHDLRVLEMTIVCRPFLPDFAGAWLDFPPQFNQEIWEDWLNQKREQFGPRWPKVQEVLGSLEALDIHMIDVSPSNIAFVEG